MFLGIFLAALACIVAMVGASVGHGPGGSFVALIALLAVSPVHVVVHECGHLVVAFVLRLTVVQVRIDHHGGIRSTLRPPPGTDLP